MRLLTCALLAATVGGCAADVSSSDAPPGQHPLKVLTTEDLRDAILLRRSLILDETTLITPSALDVARSIRG